ncbi:MAG: adenylate/guanylate cyclase domain-containing protein [Longimicrobiales bacterium]|nr:adenylate/guanylate cyclase domain-containing protein [Longimicrobiales bacterium]
MERRRAVAGVIALVATVLAYGLTHLQFFDPIFGQAEDRTLAWRQRSVATYPRDSSRIRLVLLDEESAESAPYISPFPRGVLADIIDVAAGFGADAISLDVYLERRYPELDPVGGGDQRLRAAIAKAGNVVLAAPLTQTDSGWVANPPDPYFADVAAGVGYAEIPTAFDVVTDATLFTRTINRGLVPGLALATYAQAEGLDIDSLMASIPEKGYLDLPGLPAEFATLKDDVPVHNMRILFAGPPSRPARVDVGAGGRVTGTGAEAGTGAFLAFASEAVTLLRDLVALDPDLVSDFYGFRDNIVVAGSGFHPQERFRTPFYDAPDEAGKIYGWMYGTEVHANALHDLLTGRFVRPLGGVRAFFLLLILAGITAGLTFREGATLGGVAAIGLFVAHAITAWVAFDAMYLHIPVVGPALALGFAFLGSTSYISVVEGRDKRRIRGAFSKYLSPVVVDELVADPSRLKLGGEKRELTILFTDIAGFTSISEHMEPDALVAFLNRYLDEMADIVLSEGGTLDKYIGDAIMAMYGAPAPLPGHAARACRTALRMQRRLDQLNERWARDGLPRLAMRVGINTGFPVVGNIGGEKRFDYTALGDAVNLAARLEPACKTYGVDVMIADGTRDAAGDAIVTRELELLAVYGKDEPVPVYELVALSGEELGDRAELIEQFEKGIAAYRARDFELAKQYFLAAAEVDGSDRASLIYINRCEAYMADPPPAEWDGVERRQVK